MASNSLFTPTKAGTIKITTSTSSAATALTPLIAGLSQLSVKNLDTTNTVFIDFGASSDTVTTSNGIPIGPGDIRGFTPPGGITHILTIASGSTPVLYVTPGYGT